MKIACDFICPSHCHISWQYAIQRASDPFSRYPSSKVEMNDLSPRMHTRVCPPSCDCCHIVTCNPLQGFFKRSLYGSLTFALNLKPGEISAVILYE
jgi:hypothetical protein